MCVCGTGQTRIQQDRSARVLGLKPNVPALVREIRQTGAYKDI